MDCPYCHRLLYSRQRLTCGYCGEYLPERVRFSTHEVARIQRELREIRQRREVEKAKEEEARKIAARAAAGFAFPPVMVTAMPN